jgi:hypothetical protein
MSSVYILVAKPEGKRPLGRPRHEWEDNIRLDLRKIAWDLLYLMHLTGYGPVVGYCEQDRRLSGFIKAGQFLD